MNRRNVCVYMLRGHNHQHFLGGGSTIVIIGWCGTYREKMEMEIKVATTRNFYDKDMD